jgi:ribosomal protein S18 acetylase RimI-like enzyme
MLGEECYQAVRHHPQLTREERKTGQVRRLFRNHPEWVCVLEKDWNVFGFAAFMLFSDQNYGHVDNNGVAPEHAGKGLGRFMYQHVL